MEENILRSLKVNGVKQYCQYCPHCHDNVTPDFRDNVMTDYHDDVTADYKHNVTLCNADYHDNVKTDCHDVSIVVIDVAIATLSVNMQ